MPSRTHAMSLAPDIESLSGTSSSLTRPSKRRRTEGLNARYDRMIETANIVHRPSNPVDSKRSRRQRAISSASGSSSIASHDIPRTPVDAYNDRTHGILGFSKRHIPSDIVRPLSPPTLDHDNSMIMHTPSTEPKESVPQWIFETVSSLDQYHPLRSIMPLPTAFRERLEPKMNQDIPHQPCAVDDPAIHDEQIFAFRPPTAQNSNDLLSTNALSFNNQDTTYQTADAFPTNAPYGSLDTEFATDPVQELLHQANALKQVPFTTPGPSTASFSPAFAPPSCPQVLYSQDARVNTRIPYNDRQRSSIVTARDMPTHTPIATQTTRIQSPNDLPSPATRTSASNDLMYDIVNEVSDLDQYSLSDVLRSSSLSPVDVLSPESNRKYAHPYQEALSDIQARDDPSSHTPPLTHSPILRPPVAPGFRVYFDDPIEDPSDPSSDPLEEPDYRLDLDYGPVDFKWSRFEPIGLPETPEVSRKTNNFWTKQTTVAYDRDINAMPPPRTPVRKSERILLEELQPEDDSSTIDENSSGYDTEQSRTSDESWTLLSHVKKTDNSQCSPNARPGTHINQAFSAISDPPSTRSQPTTAFAPGTGIYVSPLRNQTKEENSLTRVTMSPDPDRVPHSSPVPRISQRPTLLTSVPPENTTSALAKHATSSANAGSRMSKTLPASENCQEPLSDDDAVELGTCSSQSQQSNDTIESWSDDP